MNSESEDPSPHKSVLLSPHEQNRPTPWAKAEALAKIASLVAIPIVIAVVGWLVQHQLSDQSVKKEYVQIAVSVLREKKGDELDVPMRRWAVNLLSASSPVKLPDDLAEKLVSGEVTLEQDNSRMFIQNFKSGPVERQTIKFGDGRSIVVERFRSGDILVRTQRRGQWVRSEDIGDVANK